MPLRRVSVWVIRCGMTNRLPGCPIHGGHLWNYKFNRPYWFISSEEAQRFIKDPDESGFRDGWAFQDGEFWCGRHRLYS